MFTIFSLDIQFSLSGFLREKFEEIPYNKRCPFLRDLPVRTIHMVSEEPGRAPEIVLLFWNQNSSHQIFLDVALILLICLRM